MAIKPCAYGHFSKRGAQNKCLQCSRERAKIRRATNPEKVRNEGRTFYVANRDRRNEESKRRHAENPKIAMLRHAQKRARKGGYLCTITLADIIIPEFCPLLGVKLHVGKPLATSPSLDKIKPELGYVPGNVWVVSHRANSLKGDASLEELILLTENLKKRTSTGTPQNVAKPELTIPWSIVPPDTQLRMPWQ